MDEKTIQEEIVENTPVENPKPISPEIFERILGEVLEKAGPRTRTRTRIGITKGVTSPSKKSRNQSKKSRKINQKHAKAKRKFSGKNHRKS